MSNGGDETIIIGPPLPTGDDWDFTPRPADGLDDAHVKILPEPEPSEEHPRPQQD